MPFFEYDNVSVSAICAAVPERRRETQEYVSVFGEDTVARFIKATGILAHYEAAPGQCASDLAYAAAVHLMEREGLRPESIGALIFVSQSPDYHRPSTACVLQGRLGLSQDCAAIEIILGCTAFIYGLQTAAGLLQGSDVENVLLLCADTPAQLVHPRDQSMKMISSDAGSAVLVTRRAGAKLRLSLKTDGERFNAILLPAGGFRYPNAPDDLFVCRDGIRRSLHNLHMDGLGVFGFSTSDVPKSMFEFFDRFSLDVSQFDSLAFHQANLYILKQIIRKLKAPPESLLVSLDRYGNVGGVSIPLTLCDAYGKTDQTLEILSAGFGIGLSWGFATFSLDTAHVYEIITTDERFDEGVFTPDRL